MFHVKDVSSKAHIKPEYTNSDAEAIKLLVGIETFLMEIYIVTHVYLYSVEMVELNVRYWQNPK